MRILVLKVMLKNISDDFPTIAIEGNGSRDSHLGNGYAETDVMYTLNTVEVHAVCYEQRSKEE